MAWLGYCLVCAEGGFKLGETSDPFFIAWPTLAVGDRIGGFFYTGPPDLTEPVFFGATVVPEPASALLLATGLVAIASQRLHRRGRTGASEPGELCTASP